MAEARFQQFTDGHCGKSVLGYASLEADKVWGADLNFCGVLDDEDALVCGNELRQYGQQSRFFPSAGVGLFFLSLGAAARKNKATRAKGRNGARRRVAGRE
jgi:hypothetical protein